MIGIGISGGAFYLRAQARAVYELLKDKNGPKIYIGTSAGAVISGELLYLLLLLCVELLRCGNMHKT
jgi:hypothetical protein